VPVLQFTILPQHRILAGHAGTSGRTRTGSPFSSCPFSRSMIKGARICR